MFLGSNYLEAQGTSPAKDPCTWLEVAMNELLISLDDVKVYYDNQGQASEVLMSYETFLQIIPLIQEQLPPTDQSYFWTDSWQSRIQEAEADIQAGRIQQATGQTLSTAFEWLDE